MDEKQIAEVLKNSTGFDEYLSKKEDLHPDLKEYLDETSAIGTCLRHPLVFAIPYMEPLNAMYNEQYKVKKEYRDKAFDEGRWNSWIFIHEKPYRLQMLYELEISHAEEYDNQTFWELLGECWTNTENMWQMDDVIRELLELGEGRDNKEAMMNSQEQRLFKTLPKKFVVYRGHQGMNDHGLSWTLSPWRAKWFANRWSCDDGQVSKATAHKDNIVAIFLGRQEMEVGVIPEFLQHIEPLDDEYPEEMFDIAKNQFKLSEASYHGVWHWENVFNNAMALCDEEPKANRKICQLFAVYHDCCREDENEDPEHSHRAANFLKKIRKKLPVNDYEFRTLLQAVLGHNDGQVHDNPTIGVCWDADRMDLPRVNIIPDPKFFSTKAASRLIWRV